MEPSLITSGLTLQETSCLLGTGDAPTFGLHFVKYKCTTSRVQVELVPLPLPGKTGM